MVRVVVSRQAFAGVVRPDAAETTDGLRSLGVAHTVVLTGDNDAPAPVAAFLGIVMGGTPHLSTRDY